MRDLFRLFSLRYLRANRFRSFLALAAVALGIALTVSSHVTTTSVRASMREAVRGLAGEAEWQVTRGRSLGIEEALLPRLRGIRGAVAAPIIQASAVLRRSPGGHPAGTLMLLGVDFQTDSMLRLYRTAGRAPSGRSQADAGLLSAASALLPDGILLTRAFAESHGVQAGSTVEVETRLGRRELPVLGLLEDEGPARAVGAGFAVMELHAAQALFGRPGIVDRIEVAGATREQLLAVLPPGCAVSPAARAGSMVEDALARIDSLGVISLVALLVGLFIIYNSVQISVLERLKVIGTLRALGATRRQVLVILLLEWLAVGLLGSALGIVSGAGLARALLGYTSRTLNAIVPLIDVRHVELSPLTILVGMVMGTGTALAAALIPAWGAARSAPLDLLRPHSYRLVHHRRLAAIVGLLAVAAGLGAMGLIPASPPAGMAATALVFVGLGMLLPQVLMAAARMARPLLQRLFPLEGYLAADNTVKFPQRTALTAVALGGALAMMVATAALVGGLREATARWRSDTFPFDLAVMGTDLASSIYSGQTLPPTLLGKVRRTPGVELAYGVRSLFADFRGSDIMVVGLDMERFLRLHRRRGYHGWVRKLAESGDVPALQSGAGVYVSDNFAALFHVRAGEWLPLPTPSGPRMLRVLSVFPDYSWPRGVILMDLAPLQRLWRDDAVSYVDIGVAQGASREAVRIAVSEKLAGGYTLYIYDPEQLGRVGDDLLRQTVAVADIQVVIAIVIGFLGIVNSLLISVLQRTREIGLVRALGMTRAQVSRTVVLEGVFVALIGGLIGAIGGIIGGWLPLRLFTFAVTGYLYPLVVPWPHLLGGLAAALLIGFVASLLPARRAARLSVLDAIGYE